MYCSTLERKTRSVKALQYRSSNRFGADEVCGLLVSWTYCAPRSDALGSALVLLYESTMLFRSPTPSSVTIPPADVREGRDGTVVERRGEREEGGA